MAPNRPHSKAAGAATIPRDVVPGPTLERMSPKPSLCLAMPNKQDLACGFTASRKCASTTAIQLAILHAPQSGVAPPWSCTNKSLDILRSHLLSVVFAGAAPLLSDMLRHTLIDQDQALRQTTCSMFCTCVWIHQCTPSQALTQNRSLTDQKQEKVYADSAIWIRLLASAITWS